MSTTISLNELIPVKYYNPELGRYSKKTYWNVRINGEVHQMWFGTKRAAQSYLSRRWSAPSIQHHIEAAVRKLERNP